MRRFVIGLLLSIFSQINYGNSFFKLWGAGTIFGNYNQLLYTIEPQIRFIDRANKYDQFLLNSGLGTKLMLPFQIWLGQTYINYAVTNDIAEDVRTVVANEYRVWEQVTWHRPFFEKLASRIRLEQRRALQSAIWGIRFRQRVFWTIPIKEKIYFALNDEFFINLKSVPWVTTSTFDQNRIFVGFFYKYSSSLGFNFSYFNQFINKKSEEFNNGIVLNFIYTL